MGDVTAIAVIWARGCGGGARYGAHAPADRRTDASTTPAACDRADYSPSAGADQTAAHRPIGGIVRVREGCGPPTSIQRRSRWLWSIALSFPFYREATGVEPAC